MPRGRWLRHFAPCPGCRAPIRFKKCKTTKWAQRKQPLLHTHGEQLGCDVFTCFPGILWPSSVVRDHLPPAHRRLLDLANRSLGLFFFFFLLLPVDSGHVRHPWLLALRTECLSLQSFVTHRLMVVGGRLWSTCPVEMTATMAGTHPDVMILV